MESRCPAKTYYMRRWMEGEREVDLLTGPLNIVSLSHPSPDKARRTLNASSLSARDPSRVCRGTLIP